MIYLPIFLVIIYSFNDSKSAVYWSGFTLKWYAQMAGDRALIDSFATSVIVALSSALISSVIGTLGAVSIYKLNKGIGNFINTITYIPIIIPEIIIGVALLLFFSILPVQYGMTTLIISHTTFCIPYIFIMVQIRLKSIDKSLYEAATDLGANKVQMFFSVSLPLIFPAIISGALLAVAMSMDDVIISIFLSGPSSTTLPVKVFSMLKIGVTPKINALCSVILLFTFLILGMVLVLFSNKENKKGEI